MLTASSFISLNIAKHFLWVRWIEHVFIVLLGAKFYLLIVIIFTWSKYNIEKDSEKMFILIARVEREFSQCS